MCKFCQFFPFMFGLTYNKHCSIVSFKCLAPKHFIALFKKTEALSLEKFLSVSSQFFLTSDGGVIFN